MCAECNILCCITNKLAHVIDPPSHHTCRPAEFDLKNRMAARKQALPFPAHLIDINFVKYLPFKLYINRY
jgi:hypothetical protein